MNSKFNNLGLNDECINFLHSPCPKMLLQQISKTVTTIHMAGEIITGDIHTLIRKSNVIAQNLREKNMQIERHQLVVYEELMHCKRLLGKCTELDTMVSFGQYPCINEVTIVIRYNLTNL